MNWQELADTINSEPGHQLLQISWIPEMKQATYMHCQRALIQRVVFHENLFSIHLGWEAFFEPFVNMWILISLPTEDGKPIQIIDADITNTQPLVMEMPYGKKIIRVKNRIYQGPLMSTEIDPSSVDYVQSKGVFRIDSHQKPEMSVTETGAWVLPPNCGLPIKPVEPRDIKKMMQQQR